MGYIHNVIVFLYICTLKRVCVVILRKTCCALLKYPLRRTLLPGQNTKKTQWNHSLKNIQSANKKWVQCFKDKNTLEFLWNQSTLVKIQTICFKCNHASSDYVTFFWPGFAKSTVSTHFCGPYCVWTFLYRQTNCAPHEEKGKRRQELTTELQSVCSAIIITHSESLSLVYTKLSFFTQCHLIYAEDLTYMWVEDNYSVKKWKWLLSKKVLYIITMPNA